MMELVPDLGKNGAYIWACYGLGALLIGGAIIGTVLKVRIAKAALKRMQPSDEDAA